MNSSRLPDKVLMPILGRPMLELQMERILGGDEIASYWIATSDRLTDNPIVNLCRRNNYLYHRGDLDDVIYRLYETAIIANADIIIRLTGDCPLIHRDQISNMVKIFRYWGLDYASNGFMNLSNTPDGFDVEIMTFEVLRKLYIHSSIREHPTKDLWARPDFYGSCMTIPLSKVFYNHKLSVDTKEDFVRVKHLVEKIGSIDFNLLDIIKSEGWY